MPVTAGAREDIARAVAALRGGDDAEALASALRAWRVAPLPALADAIDALSSRFDARSRRPKGKTVADRHASWLAIAAKGDPADVPALLATFASEGNRAQLGARLAALEAMPPDPRVATALVAAIVEPGLRANDAWRSFWERLLRRIEAIGDRRVTRVRRDAERRAPLGRRTRWVDGDALRAVFDRLEAQDVAFPELAADVKTLAAEIRGAKGTPKASANELFAQVYERPDDDGTRAVLADVLQELGDPRGELIAMQLARVRGAKREKDLLREHLATWLGPLAPVVVAKTAVFARGFLDACAVACSLARVAAGVVGRPEWATVRAISLFTPGPLSWSVDPVPLLCSPAMRSLREVAHLHPNVLAALPSPRPWTRLHLSGGGGDSLVSKIEAGDRLVPALTELDCGHSSDETGSYFERLMQTALARRVEVLASSLLYDEAKIVWLTTAQRSDLAARRVVAGATDEKHGWTWALSRDARGALTVLDGSFVHRGYRWQPWRTRRAPLDRAVDMIAGLPRGAITRLTLSSTVAIAPDEETLARAIDAIRAAAGDAACTFSLAEAR